MQANPAGTTFPLELVLDARIHSTSNALLNGAVANTWLSDLAATVPGTGAQTISGYELVVVADITGQNSAIEKAIRIYPNPSGDVATIETDENSTGTYRIFDLSGRMVREGQLMGRKTSVSLHELPSGIYVLSMDENPTVRVKMIKQ
jgi:hypothetical protein